jgi:hypothetical protein
MVLSDVIPERPLRNLQPVLYTHVVQVFVPAPTGFDCFDIGIERCLIVLLLLCVPNSGCATAVSGYRIDVVY